MHAHQRRGRDGLHDGNRRRACASRARAARAASRMGVCMAGTSDAKACGAAGNACFDCTQNSASATCSGGNCSGCDATSCTNEGRTCGTSSCGFNCGGCSDGCNAGAITHYACVNKSCQMNGSGNCGLYAACASSTTCATTCLGDNGCVATAWCGGSSCKAKVALGQACSAETTGDHECASPNVCSWGPSATAGFCVLRVAVRRATRQTRTARGISGMGSVRSATPAAIARDNCDQRNRRSAIGARAATMASM